MPDGTLDTAGFIPISLTRLSLSSVCLPRTVLLSVILRYAVRNPEGIATLGLAFFHFARRYFGNRCFFLFLRLLRCFSSAGSLHTAMYSLYGDRVLLCRVSPFGNLRVKGYLLLSAAYRSLSRPSSAPDAKAFALCPFLLDQLIAYKEFVAFCKKSLFFTALL